MTDNSNDLKALAAAYIALAERHEAQIDRYPVLSAVRMAHMSGSRSARQLAAQWERQAEKEALGCL